MLPTSCSVPAGQELKFAKDRDRTPHYHCGHIRNDSNSSPSGTERRSLPETPLLKIGRHIPYAVNGGRHAECAYYADSRPSGRHIPYAVNGGRHTACSYYEDSRPI